jgi:methylated-DNA-[protein]-cysteine S-methyltransferase
MQHCLVFHTEAGFCGIAWTGCGISGFLLPAPGAEHPELAFARRRMEPGPPPPAVAEAVDAARRYFTGERVDFSGFDIDLGRRDPFHKRIYHAARRIGWGETTSYGALARQLDAAPQEARTVGEAMARNPVPLIIPCHRVLAAGGKLGGFSAVGGVASKRRMLELEGIRLAREQPGQLAFGF